MRIGIISHNYPKNTKDRKDAGIFVYDFADEMSKKNKVVVLSPSKKNSENLVGKTKVFWHKWMGGKKLGKFQFYNPFDYILYIISFINGFIRTINFVKKGKPNYIFAMWVFPAGLFALFAKIVFGIKYSIWALGSDVYVYAKYPIVGTVIVLIIKNADHVFADGFDLCKKIKKISGRSVIFLASSSKFTFKGKRSKSSKKTVVTFLGRLEKVKGPDVLINAISLLNKNKKLMFNIIGDGSLRPALEEKIKISGQNSLVKFWGNISDSNSIAKILIDSDWLVIPSRSDSIPLVFSEAAKCNVPMIVSDLPDLKLLINKYKVGYVFKVGDYKGLAKILKSLSTKNIIRKKFLNNTKKVSEDFSISKSVADFMNIIK